MERLDYYIELKKLFCERMFSNLVFLSKNEFSLNLSAIIDTPLIIQTVLLLLLKAYDINVKYLYLQSRGSAPGARDPDS